jgi:hypothetical protein
VQFSTRINSLRAIKEFGLIDLRAMQMDEIMEVPHSLTLRDSSDLHNKRRLVIAA